MSSPLDEYGMVVRHERSDSSVTQHLGLLSYRADRTARAKIPSAVPGGDQLAHRAADMGVPVIPHQWTGERDAGLLPSPQALHPVRAMGRAGGPPRIRTENLLRARELLCQLELAAQGHRALITSETGRARRHEPHSF